MLQSIVLIVLYFVMFFGIAFILNMLLRQTWIMAFIYPVIVLMIVDDFSTTKYFTSPAWAFSTVWSKIVGLNFNDVLILLFGFIGAIASGIVIKMLRKNGYQMF